MCFSHSAIHGIPVFHNVLNSSSCAGNPRQDNAKTPAHAEKKKTPRAKKRNSEDEKWKVAHHANLTSPQNKKESIFQEIEGRERNKTKKKTLQDMQGEQASKKTAFVKTERWAERGAKRSTFVLKFTFFPSTFYAKAHFSLALMVGKQKKKLLFLLLLLLLFLALRGAILQDLC